MEKISVIIPAYNAEEYIIECLESLKNQTYKNLEIIVVDDGSVDNTYALVEEYAKEHNNIVLFHQDNGGVCSARNKGLDVATGNYITFVDADDYLLEDAIDSLYKYAKSEDADVSVGTMCGEKGKIQSNTKIELWKEREGLICCLDGNLLTHSSCAKLYKKDILKGIYFEVGRKIHEDSYFVFCVMQKCPKVVTIDKTVYIYRENYDSASHAKFSEKFFDILYFAEQKCKVIRDSFPEFAEKANGLIVRAHIALLHCLCRTNEKRYNKYIKASVKIIKKYKRYYEPPTAADKKFFYIVRFGLYRLYRRIYWLKYPLK